MTAARVARLLLAAGWLALPGSAAAELLVVLNKSDADASLVDLADGSTLARLPTGAGPHEAVAAPGGGRVYVSDYGVRGRPGHTLTVLDVERRRVAATFELGEHTNPHGLAASRDGARLWVTTEGSGSVLELDAATGAIRQVWKTGQETGHMLVPSPDERVLYVANLGSGSVSAIDRATGVVRSLATGEGAEGIDRSPDGRQLWVANRGEGTLAVIDTAKLEVVARFGSGGRMPIRVKFRPGGEEVWVSNVLSNRISVFDAARREARAEIGLRLGVLPIPGPVGVLFAPDGSRAWVAHTTTDRVVEIDASSRKLLRSFETGDEPDGLAYVP